MNKVITVVEFDKLYPTDDAQKIGERVGKKVYISTKDFEALKSFVSQNENFRYLDFVKGGKGLQAKQFVGVIETKSGTVLEILPKITTDNIEVNKKVFLKMLRRLKDTKFHKLPNTSINTGKMHLLDVFIKMFADEVAQLVKKGIVSDYLLIEENLYYLKGKLKVKENFQQNKMNKERFYVAYDRYDPNRMENRIIKSALQFLLTKSRSFEVKRHLKELLFVFDDIKPIRNPKEAFKILRSDRRVKHYKQTLRWAKLFLSGNTMTTFKGKEVAYAILFDMNRVFEDYVAYRLKKDYPELSIKTQHSSKHLLESPNALFKLRPDLLLGDNMIADTKWKLLDEKSKRYGLSQSDLYQLYAYGKKYKNREKLFLIYPKSEGFTTSKIEPLQYEANMPLKLLCFDCDKDEIVGNWL